MNVLVIPEDFRKDQYILKPILTAVFAAIGRPRARITICKDPLLQGVSEALKKERLAEIFDEYRGMVDVFVLAVDRDGEETRRTVLDERESWSRTLLGQDRVLFAENAWQELEVWLLAGLALPVSWKWSALRADRDPKERYFRPLAKERGLLDAPGEGRRPLAIEAARHYDRIRQLCPEDVAVLEDRLRSWVERH